MWKKIKIKDKLKQKTQKKKIMNMSPQFRIFSHKSCCVMFTS